MRALLISTYDLGRQPFGLASPAAWLRARRLGRRVRRRREGEACRRDALDGADLIAFHLPMHTATRLAAPVIAQCAGVNPVGAPVRVRPVRAAQRRLAAVARCRRRVRRGVRRGSRAHRDVTDCGARGRVAASCVSTAASPARSAVTRSAPAHSFPRARSHRAAAAAKYATLQMPDGEPAARRLHGSEPRVPASVPALSGRADLQRPVPRRAAATSCWPTSPRRSPPAPSTSRSAIPDFFNGPTHAMRIVEALHAAHPAVTYDVTIKVEHLLQHRDLLPRLRGDRLRVRDERGRIGRRSRCWRSSTRATRARISSRRSRCAARPA